MERRTSLEEAKLLLGKNFIGIEELAKIATNLGIHLPDIWPEIPFTNSQLAACASDCILILGVDIMANGEPVSLFSLRKRFGTDPFAFEPCFYNQDWYLNELFFQTGLDKTWYLLNKNVFEESRGLQPEVLQIKYQLPKAVLSAYTFFAYWFHAKEILWQDDFIWCTDKDHNGDLIYVGKYFDKEGINKNGFSVHRHLSIKQNYAAISCNFSV